MRLNLFLNIMETVHSLIEEGITSCSVNEAFMHIDSLFDDFEENDGIEQSKQSNRHKMFEDTFFRLEHMPEEIKQYCYTIDTFHRKNDIYLEALPTLGNTMEQAQLIAGIFGILNKLLEVGITSCHNHQARTELYNLFNDYMRQEDIKTAQPLKILLIQSQTILPTTPKNIHKLRVVKRKF